MSEPIDREVTLLLLDVAIKQFGENWLQDKMTKNGLLIAKRIVSKQPTIEAEPVRRGRWIECCNELDKKCSCCDKVYGTIYEKESFCPHCGARMEDN